MDAGEFCVTSRPIQYDEVWGIPLENLENLSTLTAGVAPHLTVLRGRMSLNELRNSRSHSMLSQLSLKMLSCDITLLVFVDLAKALQEQFKLFVFSGC